MAVEVNRLKFAAEDNAEIVGEPIYSFPKNKEPVAPANVNVANASRAAPDGTMLYAARIDFTKPSDPYVTGFFVRYRQPGETEYVVQEIDGSGFVLDLPREGNWEIQVQTRNLWNQQSPWISPTVQPTLIGKQRAISGGGIVSATGFLNQIKVEVEYPEDQADIRYAVVFGNTVNNPVGSAELGKIDSTKFEHTGLTGVQTWYYWLKFEDNLGNRGEFTDPAGVGATTTQASGDDIQDGVLTPDKFEVGFDPVQSVSSLPTTGNYVGRTVLLLTDNTLYNWNGSNWVAMTGNLAEASGIQSVDTLPGGLGPSDQGKVVFLKSDNKIYRWTGSAWIASTATSDLVGQIVEAQIANGALAASKFPSNVRPIEVLGALPSTGNTAGRQVYLTTDGKVYRWTGSAWTTGVSASDIVGSVPSAIPYGPTNPGTGSYEQLFLNTTDKKLYRWNGTAWTTATNGADITAGTITGDRLQAGTIQTAQLGANVVTASKIAVTSSNINPDPNYSDLAFWQWDGDYTNWYPETGNQIPDGFHGGYFALWNQYFTGTQERSRYSRFLPDGAIKPGMVIKLRARIRNNSNRPIMAILHGYDHTGAFVGQAVITANAYSGTADRISAAWTVPANVVKFRFVLHAPAGAAFSGDAIMGPIYATEVSTGELIVDGAIKAVHMSADSVTAGAVAAGSIGTTKLFVGASAENLVVNSTGREGNDGWNLHEGSNAGVVLNGFNGWYTTGRYGFSLSKPSTSTQTAWGSRAFPMIPGRKYSVRFNAAGNTSTASGMYVRVNWKTDRPANDAMTHTTRHGVIPLVDNGPVIGGAGPTPYEFSFTAPTNAYWGSFVIYNWNGGPTELYFADVEVKEQTTGVMIADGSIFANHMTANSIVAGSLAANSVTTNALAAGSVVAGKMSVSDLSAISANVGTITAGLLRNSPGTMQVDLNNSRIVFNNGVTMKVTGNGFGTSNQFIEWSGPSMAINQCSEANAVTYLRTDGRAYFGGSITAGTISNSVRGTSTTVPAASTLGPFGTNGNPITIVWSYDYSRIGYRWDNQTPSGSTSALVRLFRSVNGGGETLVDSMSITGYFNYSYDGEPVPGQPAGTTGRTFFNEYMGNSRTFTDSGGGSGTRTYRIEVVSRTLGTISGESGDPDSQSQNYGITSSE
jgi:hypothetical protein